MFFKSTIVAAIATLAIAAPAVLKRDTCSSSSTCTGDATYYDTADTSSNPSSCGTTNDGTVENVLALSQDIITDADCGKTVVITYNGVTANGTVVDKCMGCDADSIDLSRHLFEELADLDAGRLSGVEWYIAA
ncbi:hypothetical protein ASPZODRAFT_135276 [Penicilliopsis zonata CBS 506.65]|uniref:RlpA-like protein double-psi beta-barrel domain-containing protein n=1 Tax=Penicilliopsis zonata CBS 506.65 TaxID=1073090 RepID=A0A1L9SBB5_9EURO|nr:hypothetical protein ASPZODRAFT_135276 [Penicilliopsis zonata CBS 506.65]OJJ44451.1 hypothetical protein ASPZODRAFT_135276 [Penicilliopsis zonata CBS 506.65]